MSGFSPKIDSLCFSGGGVKGCAFLGALMYMEEHHYINLQDIKTFAGCSIGSMMAFLLSLQYTIMEIIDFILEFNFENLEPTINCENIFTNYGLCDSNKIGILMGHFLNTKYKKTDITFIELYHLTNNKLIINGANISESKVEYFDYLRTPNMSVITAIKISSCVPVLFNPILHEGKYYVDGGAGNSFPINQCNQATTLGFLIVTNNRAINSIHSVFFAALSIMMNEPNTQYVDTHHVIRIQNTNIECIDFKILRETKQMLIDIGKKSAIQYMELKDSLKHSLKHSLKENIKENCLMILDTQYITESFIILNIHDHDNQITILPSLDG